MYKQHSYQHIEVHIQDSIHIVYGSYYHPCGFSIITHNELYYHGAAQTIVIRSSKMSLNSKKIKTQFSFQLDSTISELYHAENPIKIEHLIPEI